jgi:hypothetical protein
MALLGAAMPSRRLALTKVSAGTSERCRVAHAFADAKMTPRCWTGSRITATSWRRATRSYRFHHSSATAKTRIKAREQARRTKLAPDNDLQ